MAGAAYWAHLDAVRGRCGQCLRRVEVAAFFERADGGDIIGDLLLRGDDLVADGIDFTGWDDVVDDAEAVAG